MIAAAAILLAAPLIDPHVGGMAFPGPTAARVSAIHWNPAAMGQLTGHHVLVLGSSRLDVLGVERAAISGADGEPGDGADLTFDPVDTSTFAPGAFAGVVTDLNLDRYRFGLAVFSPYTERQPKAEGLSYHARGGFAYALYTTLAIAVKVSDNLSVGGGLGLAFTAVDIGFDRDRGLEDPTTCASAPAVENPACRQELSVRSTDASPSFLFSIGAFLVWPNHERLVLGLSYLSEPTTTVKSGTVKVREFFPAADGEPVMAPALSGQARIAFRLPQQIHGGVRYHLSRGVDLVANGHWYDLSAHRLFDLRFGGADLRERQVPEWLLRDRGLEDVLTFDAGAEWIASQYLILAATAAYSTSAVEPRFVSPSQVDGGHVELSAGAEVRFGGRLTLQAGYALELPVTADVTESAYSPSAFTRCRESGYAIDACENARQGRAIPSAAGGYERTTHTFAAGVGYHWW